MKNSISDMLKLQLDTATFAALNTLSTDAWETFILPSKMLAVLKKVADRNKYEKFALT
jgi:hypothetical protein